MARKIIESSPESPERAIAPVTPEDRENLMIALAMDLAEQRLRDGTASAQEVVHFLKLGASTTKQDKKLVDKNIELADAKVQAIKQTAKMEELYADAISAMKMYSGQRED